MNLTISNLHVAYQNNTLTPELVIDAILKKSKEFNEHKIWIALLDKQQIKSYLDKLDGHSPMSLPLFGIPFAIKDNIDLAGVPTTAACPAYTYIPEQSAFVVQQLLDAGAIPIGKTNMDQFATGLVGTRSPALWGACRNVFNKDYISGGSSAGSAVAVAAGLVSFALGTDTAGSGRVPAAYNNIIGLKPSKGLLSTRGVVPACRSLDCVSIFALNSDDADRVFEQAAVFDREDDYARPNVFANNHRHYGLERSNFRFAIPRRTQLEFFGNQEAESLFNTACDQLRQMGGEPVEIDFESFLEVARLLYEGPWVTERYVAIEEFINHQADALLPVINTIIGSGKTKMASDAYKAFYRLQHCKRQTDAIMDSVDILVSPTAGTIYTVDEVNVDPIKLNSNVGYYTNYMNLLDYAAIAIPAGFLSNGLPFGITLAGQAWEDRKLLSFARQWQQNFKFNMGKTEYNFEAKDITLPRTHTTYVDLVVCGAHLQGFPLNWQLTERGGVFIESTQTAANYRLYDLPSEGVKRPGMFRDIDTGTAIAVEVWRLPIEEFGGFVSDIPAPLGIGKVEMHDGDWKSGFICEPYIKDCSREITEFGGWAGYSGELNTV